MPASAPASSTVPDYVGLLRRRGWLILLVTCLGVLGADLLARAVPRSYEATTAVLVQPAGQDTNAVGGRTKDAINLDTEAQVVRSDAVTGAAAALLRSSVPAGTLVAMVDVEVPANTTVLRIGVTGPTPQHAQAWSRAIAAAYLANREQTARAVLSGQGRALGARLYQLNVALARVNRRLATIGAGTGRPQLESQRQTLVNQIDDLSEQNNQLTTSTVRVGRVISDAPLPEAPITPNRMLYLASGAMVGLLLGSAAAMLRERCGRRLRHAADVRRRSALPVLAALDRRTAPLGLLPPHGPGGRMFHRLRNEVVAGLNEHSRVLVVTSTVDGLGGVLVAVNLAAALARTGDRVILVSGQRPASDELAAMLGIPDGPGLGALAAGTAPLAAAAQHSAPVPGLRVVIPALSDPDPLPVGALRAALDTIRADGGYVVVAAPSTATGAEAQGLASLSDAAIVAVPLHLTGHAQLADAEEQLTRVGVRLLGAVVLPRTVRRRAPARVPSPPAPRAGSSWTPVRVPEDR